MDLFPTILDFLGLAVSDCFDGTSLLQARPQFAVITADNGNRDPVKFCIQSPYAKAFFSYRSRTSLPGRESTIFLEKVTDPMDRVNRINVYQPSGADYFRTNFRAGLQLLYPTLVQENIFRQAGQPVGR